MSGPDEISLFVVPSDAPGGQLFSFSLGEKLGTARCRHERTVFPSGEMIVALPSGVADRAVVVLAPSHRPSDALVELLLLADALHRQGVRSITCVLQYVPYSRSNRLNRPGLPLGSKVIASMIEQSPISRLVVFDLHAREILGYFSKPVTWLPTLQLMSDAMPQHSPEVVVSPDRGRYDDCIQISGIRKCATDLLVKVRRDDSGSSELLAGARTELDGRSVVLFDDEIWTGVTASQAARSLLGAGAARIDYLTVYDYTTPEVRKRMLEDIGVSSFTTTNLALPTDETYEGRYRVLDAASLLVEQWPRIVGL